MPLPARQEILLVDDEEDILLELAELIESEGFVCHTASSVRAALAQLERHPGIALAITDLRMPEESGLRLIQRLRQNESRRDLPVIVTSGHAEMDDVVEALRLQVIDFFRKPIYHDMLFQTLNRLFPVAGG
ncbi:response regulator [Pseudomonas sp. LRF_L74]|uniref:response regulator n=1 Tax=Pseudomonas sp. LRF_L74 TaxID=3369422 RepID=UPI003F63A382